jgi:hypothetical protein
MLSFNLLVEELIDGYDIVYRKGPVNHILDFGSARSKTIQSFINDGYDEQEGDLKWLLLVNDKECILARDENWNKNDPIYYWFYAPFGARTAQSDNEIRSNQDALDAAEKFIKTYEVKKNLSTNTKETFNDLIDEL